MIDRCRVCNKRIGPGTQAERSYNAAGKLVDCVHISCVVTDTTMPTSFESWGQFT